MSKTPFQVTAIGFFVLTALVLLIAMLMAFGGNSWFRTTVTYTMHFDNSVKGLSAGSPVMFRGVTIGQVTGIRLLAPATNVSPDTPADSFSYPVQVTVEIEPEKLGFSSSSWRQYLTGEAHAIREELRNYLTEMAVKQGLRAKLQTLSLLTGQLSIEMTFDHLAMETDDPVQIRADMQKGLFPTRIRFLDQVSNRIGEKNFRNQMESLQKLIAQISDFIDSGQSKQLLEDISRIAANLRTLTETLGQQLPVLLDDSHAVLTSTNELVCHAKDQIQPLVKRVLLLATQIGFTLQSAHKLLNNLTNITESSKPQIERLLTQCTATLSEAQQTLVETRAALQEAQAAIAPASPTRQQLERTLNECELSLNSLRMLLDHVQRDPQFLFLGE
ncbi:MAG: MCE family protein [Victivallales bacterium]|nr:MCE family protein [Victivallales bacterium]